MNEVTLPHNSWVRKIAKKYKKQYWRDLKNKKIFYYFDEAHGEDVPRRNRTGSWHIEVYKMKGGTKYAYLVAKIDPLDFSKTLQLKSEEIGRRIEL